MGVGFRCSSALRLHNYVVSFWVVPKALEEKRSIIITAQGQAKGQYYVPHCGPKTYTTLWFFIVVQYYAPHSGLETNKNLCKTERQ